jgi:hypothetical protein
VTVKESLEYNSISPLMILACGHKRIAILMGMAERTPKVRAS